MFGALRSVRGREAAFLRAGVREGAAKRPFCALESVRGPRSGLFCSLGSVRGRRRGLFARWVHEGGPKRSFCALASRPVSGCEAASLIKNMLEKFVRNDDQNLRPNQGKWFDWFPPIYTAFFEHFVDLIL